MTVSVENLFLHTHGTSFFYCLTSTQSRHFHLIQPHFPTLMPLPSWSSTSMHVTPSIIPLPYCHTLMLLPSSTSKFPYNHATSIFYSQISPQSCHFHLLQPYFPSIMPLSSSIVIFPHNHATSIMIFYIHACNSLNHTTSILSHTHATSILYIQISIQSCDFHLLQPNFPSIMPLPSSTAIFPPQSCHFWTTSTVYVVPKLDTDSTCVSNCRQLTTQASVCTHLSPSIWDA